MHVLQVSILHIQYFHSSNLLQKPPFVTVHQFAVFLFHIGTLWVDLLY